MLDDLDHLLLDCFEASHPKPSTLDYCEHDASSAEVSKMCSSRLFEHDLATSFAASNRLGLVGDWRDFPAFAAEVAIHCRRQPLTYESDLAAFHLHLSSEGCFGEAERTVLRKWVEDLLFPWERSIQRSDYLSVAGHSLDVLGLGAQLGIDLQAALRRNLDELAVLGETPLLVSLYPYMGPKGSQLMRAHFEQLEHSFDNQSIPGDWSDMERVVNSVINAVREESGRNPGVST